jgi:hypothetical protein
MVLLGRCSEGRAEGWSRRLLESLVESDVRRHSFRLRKALFYGRKDGGIILVSLRSNGNRTTLLDTM